MYYRTTRTRLSKISRGEGSGERPAMLFVAHSPTRCKGRKTGEKAGPYPVSFLNTALLLSHT